MRSLYPLTLGQLQGDIWIKFESPLSTCVGLSGPLTLAPIADVAVICHECRMERSEFLKTASPHLVVDVIMYATAAGGRRGPAPPGWGCPCMTSQLEPFVGYDGWPLLGDTTLLPGEQRRLGFYFPSFEDAVPILRSAGRFYLWEGKFIVEAKIVR